MRIWIGGLVLAGAAAVLFIGCGQDQEETIDIGVVDQQPAADEGLSIFSRRKHRSSGPPPGPPVTVLPVHFPEDIPLYEGCEVVNVNAGAASKLIMAILKTPDDMQNVVDFYNNATVESGWEQLSFMMPTTIAMMSFAKEGRSLSLLIRPMEDGGTSIHLTTRIMPSISQ